METAHRITNVCYPRGSVIYAKFEKGSEYYYLNMRPLIVVSNQIQMFDSLTVIGCGSKDRPGVQISLFNHQLGQWIGGHEYSIAQPYAIFSITTTQIVEFHGVIDQWTMKAIDKAMAFHLGLSDEVPPYMEYIWEELLEPKYRMGTENNSQLKDPHQFGSQHETTRKFKRIPSINKDDAKKDIGKTYKSNDSDSKPLRPNLNTIESVKKRIEQKYGVQDTPKIKEYTIPEEALKPSVESSETTGPIRKGTAVLIIPDPNDAPETISDVILNIANSLSEAEKIKCITRKMAAGNYGTITIYANQIPQIRKAIEITYNLTTGEFGAKLADRICHQQRNFRFLSQFERIAAILYSTPEELQISEAAYKEVARQVIKENHLKFDDGRSWRNFKNFERLKKITNR